MSRASIGEAYYRLKYEAYESKAPVCNQLNRELISLRKSTRNALQQSWDEVETLQQQCAINAEVIAQHDTVVTQMREQEKAWQGRCLIAEEKLKEKPEEKNSLRHHHKLSFPQIKPSWVDRDDFQDSATKSQETSEQRDSLRYHKRFSWPQSIRSWVGRNNERDNLELVLRISSRDEAILSLEQTLDEKLKSIQDMQTEMKSLVETQRTRENKMRDSHAQKEDHFNDQIESLREELSNTVSRIDT